MAAAAPRQRGQPEGPVLLLDPDTRLSIRQTFPSSAFRPEGVDHKLWSALCAGRLERISLADLRVIFSWHPQLRRLLRL